MEDYINSNNELLKTLKSALNKRVSKVKLERIIKIASQDRYELYKHLYSGYKLPYLKQQICFYGYIHNKDIVKALLARQKARELIHEEIEGACTVGAFIIDMDDKVTTIENDEAVRISCQVHKQSVDMMDVFVELYKLIS